MKLIFEYQPEQISAHIKHALIRDDKAKRGDDSSNSDPSTRIIDLFNNNNNLIRENLPIPDLSELTVVRHYTNLSRINYGIDTGFYPLGSCTMKYNPKINEDISSLEGFRDLHPYSDIKSIQGSLKVMWELEQYLIELTGMDSFSLQPSAGAQAELLGLMIAKAYFADRQDNNRTKVIIPDSAHGSNPASAAMIGYQTLSIPTNSRGNLDFKGFERALDGSIAVIMLTNPNTLGLYEENILDVSKASHLNGSLMYCDGANMNALLGINRPADQGFDMIHLNLHKTFSTPHGGGGPGAGVLGVKSKLTDYLPIPRIIRRQSNNDPSSHSSMHTTGSADITLKPDNNESPVNLANHRKALVGYEERGSGRLYYEFVLDHTRRKSVGRIKCFYGNFGTLLRAYSYLLSWGSSIKTVSEGAILNANYLMSLLKGVYELPYDRPCAHEFVLTSKRFGKKSAMSIAKRLMDYGYHPPTIYFPLIVSEALMIEPTETESKQTLDEFADALIKIAEEFKAEPESVWAAPHTTRITRLDEVTAARRPNLRWNPPG